MSYRLTTDEEVADGIRRIAREQLERALCGIGQAAAGEEAKAVHATRKRIKKTRALLRLIRDEIGKEIFGEENRRLREMARSLSGSRDAGVQLQVLEKLSEATMQDGAAFPRTAAALEKKMAEASGGFSLRQEEAEAALLRICDRLEDWPLEDLEMTDLACALKNSYRRARKCLRCVASDATAENFHSWRKRVKDIWYQARILQHLSRDVLCAVAEAAKTLGQHLGDLHDLAFFREWLVAAPDLPEEERSVLLGLICTREKELERVALDLGARFFAEKPGAFERRLLRFARAWPAPVLSA